MNELQADYVPGKNVYFLLRNSVGQVWNGSSFVTYVTANYATYFLTATEQGTASGYYTADMPGANAGLFYMVAKERLGGSPAESDFTVGTGTILWNGSSAEGVVYQAKVWMADDNNAGTPTDRYAAVWFRNSTPVVSGITSPTIEVIKASDGSDLIASSTMTQIAATGLYRYNATGSERIADGAMYIAKVTATIDGATRSWFQQISRDSSSS